MRGWLRAILALYGAGTIAWRAEGGSEAAHAAYAANQTADLLLQAAGNWAVERGATTTALNAPAVAAETRSIISQRRTAADQAAAAALSQIAGSAEAAATVRALDTARQALATLRLEADAAMALPMSGRPDGLAGRWFRGITAVIQTSQRLRQETAFHDLSPNAQLAWLQQMKQEIWIVSEYAGRERAIVGGIVAAGRAISTDRLLELGIYRGKVEMAWDDVQSLATGSTVPQSIRTAIDAAQQAYFVQFQAVRAKIYAAGLAGAAYPISGQEWVAEATKAIDAVLALSQAAGRDTAEIATASAETEAIAVWGSIAALVVVLGITAVSMVVVTAQVVRPLTEMSGATRQLAAGALDAVIPCQGWTDELGGLAASVTVLRDGLLQKVELEGKQAAAAASRAVDQEHARQKAEQEIAEAALVVNTIGGALKRLAARDLSVTVATALPESYDQLRVDLNTAVDQLHSAMVTIMERVNTIGTGTGEIAQASEDLSKRTEIQAASLEQTAAALDQLTATVRQTAEAAMSVSVVISKTRTDAEHSGVVVQQAFATMEAIQESSRRISEVTSIIDEMAFQTNLLALNAGVEAARAGEAGRGFAVVASEVRSLAQRSAEAAKEIKSLITASGAQVDKGVKLVGDAGKALTGIVQQVGEITGSVAGIAAAAQEQSIGLHELNSAVNQMDQVMQQNAAMVEETSAASVALAQETSELVQLTRRFQVDTPADRPTAAPATASRAARPAPQSARPTPQKVASAGRRPGPVLAEAGEWAEF
jgi:methyl-accepting chemotaxis protein